MASQAQNDDPGGALADARRQMAEICRRLHAQGLTAALDGNVSLRLSGGRYLVTPAGAHKGLLDPEALVVVDASGAPLEDDERAVHPSSELAMHLAVMRARPDVNAVVHAHAPSAVALSLIDDPQLDGVLSEAAIGLGELAVLPYVRPGTPELGHAAATALAERDVVILARHGTLAVGRSLVDAYALTEGLEHASRILWMAHCVRRPRPLDQAEQDALRALHRRARERRWGAG